MQTGLEAQKGRFQMGRNKNFLKKTLDLIETDPEVKSYIYQQIHDFTPFVTPETMVMVVARDPKGTYRTDVNLEDQDELASFEASEQEAIEGNYKFRIAIVLKEGDTKIEAEAFHNDIFEAIRLAKDNLVARLVEIRNEIESPQDRIRAIRDANDNTQIH